MPLFDQIPVGGPLAGHEQDALSAADQHLLLHLNAVVDRQKRLPACMPSVDECSAESNAARSSAFNALCSKPWLSSIVRPSKLADNCPTPTTG